MIFLAIIVCVRARRSKMSKSFYFCWQLIGYHVWTCLSELNPMSFCPLYLGSITWIRFLQLVLLQVMLCLCLRWQCPLVGIDLRTKGIVELYSQRRRLSLESPRGRTWKPTSQSPPRDFGACGLEVKEKGKPREAPQSISPRWVAPRCTTLANLIEL